MAEMTLRRTNSDADLGSGAGTHLLIEHINSRRGVPAFPFQVADATERVGRSEKD